MDNIRPAGFGILNRNPHAAESPLTPKYGRMCASAAVAGGKLSMTKGKNHGICWAQGLESQSQYPLKGKGTTQERGGRPQLLRTMTLFYDDVMAVNGSLKVKCIPSSRDWRETSSRGQPLEAFRAVLTDTACQNKRWNDFSLLLSWSGHPGPRSWQNKKQKTKKPTNKQKKKQDSLRIRNVARVELIGAIELMSEIRVQGTVSQSRKRWLLSRKPKKKRGGASQSCSPLPLHGWTPPSFCPHPPDIPYVHLQTLFPFRAVFIL